MKTRLAIPALLLAVAFPSLASALSDPSQPMTLVQAVDYMQSLYPGEVVAAELDTSGDKPAHYHVDIRFPHGRTAYLEVDALTRAIASRMPSVESGPGTMDLVRGAQFIAAHYPGTVTLAEIDGSNAKDIHYHVDMRLANGRAARFRLDPENGAIRWRNPDAIDR